MRDWDLTAIFHFLNHPRMYLGNSDNEVEERVDVFLSAYQMGAKLECRFRDILLEHLMAKYKISSHPGGFVLITKTAARIKKTDSLTLITREGTEVLQEISDGDGKNRFAKILRKKIADYLEKELDPKTYVWEFINWNRIVGQVEKWPGVNLNVEEMELFMRVTETWRKRLSPWENEVPEDLKNDMALLKELVEQNLAQG